MGRLLESLLANSQPASIATPATLATLPAPSTPKVAESQESQRGPAANAGEQRARLLALVEDELLPAALVYGLPDADVLACDDLPDNTLRAYLRALEARQRMDAGQVPLEWGEPVARECEGCGPVLLWANCPPIVKACPWCFRRKAMKAVPRPLVACGECRHYLPSALNPTAGLGACMLGRSAYWPMKLHRCPEWGRDDE